MKLNGKTVVVTGASSGIGRAVSIELARRGGTLFVAARRAEELESVAAPCRTYGGSATPVVTDVSDRASCEQLVATAGRVDVLINNAGFAVFDPIDSAKPDDLESMRRTDYFRSEEHTSELQ